MEGVLAYFTHLKCQKRIKDDVGDCQMTPLVRFIHLIIQEYDSKCLKMYLITLKVFKLLAPITKVKYTLA
jgi:hypothetical protein